MVELNAAEIERSFDLYADMLLRLAFQHVKNQQDAEDIVQDAFLRLQQQGSLESREHIKSWLIHVTSNLCVNELRRAKRRREVPLEDAWVRRDEAQTNVLELIGKLDPKYRNALYLHYYEGYRTTEIAEIYHVPPNTVVTWLKRGRERLKLVIEEEAYEY
ncbi:MAG: RNA polymerase sigma factor [Bacteroides sp.]|nr:RNA polymerase sigma factor [Eubacterium sp.]MCM1418448.1 RNA polymerase sigma factor [Roseburia sp.]MCM1462044.1 RNA polymerase sigma factor [Bacteroides sp.]